MSWDERGELRLDGVGSEHNLFSGGAGTSSFQQQQQQQHQPQSYHAPYQSGQPQHRFISGSFNAQPQQSLLQPRTEDSEHDQEASTQHERQRQQSSVAFSESPLAAGLMGVLDVVNKFVIGHPCTVLRRQCQIHQKARFLHLHPFGLPTVVCNLVAQQGLTTLWKGSIGTLIVTGLETGAEIVIAEFFGLPRTTVQGGSRQKYLRHLVLKASTYFVLTPFYISSFIDTVRSEAGMSVHDIRVFEVLKRAVNRLKWDIVGGDASSQRFLVLYLAPPTVVFRLSHYLLAGVFHRYILDAAQQFQRRKKERTSFDRLMPQLIAGIASSVLADLALYPFELILHRLYVQGTRTLIDNLDTGSTAISLSVKYSGLLDCVVTTVRSEQAMALYAGVGALTLQCGLQWSMLRLTSWVYTRCQAWAQQMQSDGSGGGRTAPGTPPSLLDQMGAGPAIGTGGKGSPHQRLSPPSLAQPLRQQQQQHGGDDLTGLYGGGGGVGGFPTFAETGLSFGGMAVRTSPLGGGGSISPPTGFVGSISPPTGFGGRRGLQLNVDGQ